MATETRSCCQGALPPARGDRYTPQQNVRDKTTLPLVRSGVALYLSLFDCLVLGRDTVESVLYFSTQGGTPRA